MPTDNDGEVVKRKRKSFDDILSIFRILNERNDIVRDHQNVERAFTDLNSKYERAKDVVAGLKCDEENLKQNVEILTSR